jgi:hypothetical protein
VLKMVMLNVAVVLGAGLAGAGICRAVGVDPHGRDVALAAAIALVAACAGAAPIAFRRGVAADIGGIFQACFLGTVLHLATAVVLTVVVLLTLRPGNAFVYWMLVMYWLTLGGLCAIFVRTLRKPTSGAPGQGG